jgi:hypothetical protein
MPSIFAYRCGLPASAAFLQLARFSPTSMLTIAEKTVNPIFMGFPVLKLFPN